MGMHEQLEIYLKCFNRYMVECEYTKANLMKMIAGTF